MLPGLLHGNGFFIFQPRIRREYWREMAKNKFMTKDCKFLLNTQISNFARVIVLKSIHYAEAADHCSG